MTSRWVRPTASRCARVVRARRAGRVCSGAPRSLKRTRPSWYVSKHVSSKRARRCSRADDAAARPTPVTACYLWRWGTGRVLACLPAAAMLACGYNACLWLHWSAGDCKLDGSFAATRPTHHPWSLCSHVLGEGGALMAGVGRAACRTRVELHTRDRPFPRVGPRRRILI